MDTEHQTDKNQLDSAVCARYLGLSLYGDIVDISRVAGLGEDCEGAIMFASAFQEKYVAQINNKPRNFIIAHVGYADKLSVPHVLSDNPRRDFCKLSKQFFPKIKTAKIEPSAWIGEGVILGAGVYIGHNVVIEDGVRIGEGSQILHNVVIAEGCQIGDHCLIKSGTIIGQKGFGFERDSDGTPIEFTHYGKVVIGDYVEIGALNTVAAGALSDTVIEDHVKTDDHVHIAHNVKIGWATLITACSELSGSVTVGREVWLGPNSSVIEKTVIGDRAFVGIGAVVTKSIPEKVVVVGYPGKILRDIDP